MKNQNSNNNNENKSKNKSKKIKKIENELTQLNEIENKNLKNKNSIFENKIPNEILANIFLFCEPNQVYEIIPLINKRWNSISTSQILFKSMCESR